MSADGFSDALRSAVPLARVEAQGRVAIISAGATLLLDGASRRRIVAMAREHGFSNVALELTPDANLPGDQSPR